MVDEYGKVSTRLVWGYPIAPLSECRKAFEDLMGIPIDWEESEDVNGELVTYDPPREAIDDEIPF